VRLAVAGRPNAGKSTLINTWLGEERLVAFDMPGTTRDAITVPFERNGQKFELIDTAGLRRKGKVFEAIEKFSVVKTLQAIEGANVVLLLIDATQGVTDQDAHIAGYILESGRSVVLGINKWDAVDDYQRQMLERSIETRLSFLKFAPLHFISAQKRQGLEPLWKSIIQAHRAATCKMPTPVLTRILMERSSSRRPRRWSLSPQDALCPPGRHEPAHHRDPWQLAGWSPMPTSAFWKGVSARSSIWSAPLRID
jgi:GTP-binding protein